MTRGVPKCHYVRHRPGYELRRARGIKEAFATRFPHPISLPNLIYPLILLHSKQICLTWDANR